MAIAQALQTLTPDAKETDVEQIFSKSFLKELGFDDLEVNSQHPVGNGNQRVDWAARKNSGQDIFFQTKNAPALYMEVKGRDINLTEGHPQYFRTLTQLRRYMLAPSSQSVQWGVVMNSLHAQLFRKHGKAIHPATPCLPFEDDGSKLIQQFKRVMAQPRRALTLAVYNNKGGVGKTTTAINLAGTFFNAGKKALLIDLDPNQGDLTSSLGLQPRTGIAPLLQQSTKRVSLAELRTGLLEAIQPYRFQHPRLKRTFGFDVITADPGLANEADLTKLRQKTKTYSLYKLLKAVQQDYDYIVIDTPPGLTTFPQISLCAADVILVPVRHDNHHSLENAGEMIAQHVPRLRSNVQKMLGIPGPIALPVFLNYSHALTETQVAIMHQMIDQIIKKHAKTKFDLRPYFYPKRKPKAGSTEAAMISVPYLSPICLSDFRHVPGVFWHKRVKDYYDNLAKEYFLA